MGRVVVDFVLSNYLDLAQVQLGTLTPDKVRRVVVQGVVDTGATRLVLPESVVNQLQLPRSGQTAVRFADHRRAKRDMVTNAYVELLGRGGFFDAVVEPNRSDALLGAIVMEVLDLIVDCPAQRVMPREPDMILTEVE
jgi:predicted aspartyl protease